MISDLNRDMFDGTRWTDLGISETADLLGNHTQHSLEFSQNRVENKTWSKEQFIRVDKEEYFNLNNRS